MASCQSCSIDLPSDATSKRRKFCTPCKDERRKITARVFMRKRYQAYYAWLREKGCSSCRINSPSCLEVHHLCKDSKRFGSLRFRGQSDQYNKKDVESGIAIVLCANCHSTFHRHWGGKGATFPDQTLESTLEIIRLEYNRWRLDLDRT